MAPLKSLQNFLIKSDKTKDYFYLFFIGLIPILLSYFFGIHRSPSLTTNEYLGYWDEYSWTSFIITLPAGLYLLRWLSNVLFGIPEREVSSSSPPLICLFDREDIREKVREDLKKIALNPTRVTIILLINIMFQFFDSLKDLRNYIEYFNNDLSIANFNRIHWEFAFLLQEKYPNSQVEISACKNLFFYLLANLSEFIILFIATTAIVLVLQHNLFFLQLIYQRDRAQKYPNRYYAVVKFQDPERSFGLRVTHKAFNFQVLCLVIAGCFTLVSRYANVSVLGVVWPKFSLGSPHAWLLEIVEKIPLESLFPSFGQVVAAITWLFAFGIVLLPSLVKFLPLLSQNVRSQGLSITSYLKQFIPPEDEKDIYQLNNDEQVSKVAEQFAKGSFWPGGDDVAKFILYFASFVLIIIIFPISINPKSLGLTSIFILFSVLLIAISMANGILWFLRQALTHVDRRLVEGKK